jgi:putative DNA primase/helicase
MPAKNLLDAASGRWPEILMGLGGLSADQLQDKHQPCPACGGEDRYRWDSDEDGGSWFCNQCGGKDHCGGGGNGADLLMRVRGWDFRETTKQVQQFLGLDTVSDSVKGNSNKPFRQAEKPPTDASPPTVGRNAVAQWCYRNAEGEQLFWVQRINTTNKGVDGKLFLLVLWLDGKWHTVRKTDPFKADWPEPRPLYRLPDLADRPDAMVVIAEGEKAVDAAAELFPDAACIGWRNGAKAARKSDWSTLEGRDVVFLPDNDKDGKASIGVIAGVLRDAGARSVRVCHAPEGSPVGWDIADALADGWASLDAEIWLQDAVEVDCRAAQADLLDPGTDASPGPADRQLDHGPARWDAFTILGFNRGTYFYHPAAAGQITALNANMHSSNNLFGIAPLEWWRSRWPRYNKDGDIVGVDWQSLTSDLMEAQHKVGIYDPWRVRGAGVWLDGDKAVMHLGDRLVIDGKSVDVRKGPEGTSYIYDKTKAIKGPGNAKPMDDDDGLAIIMLASKFNWEENSAGMLLVGWVFLAPICGALDWRPHIWLTAAAGSGKSTVLERFVLVLLGDFACVPIGGSTEPGIRQELSSAALPVVFDEAESNEEADKTRMTKVIDAARVSSSRGQGKVMKGTPGGVGMAFALRSMWFLCSIATALKNSADKTRFAVLTLIKSTEKMSAEQAARQWAQIDAELAQVATPQNGRAMIARAFSMVHIVRAAVPVFTTACAAHLGTQRLGDQYGTLCAGAWCLANSRVPTEQDAVNWLTAYPLTKSAEESQSEADEKMLYEAVTQHQIRAEVIGSGSQARTVREIAQVAMGWAGAVPKGLLSPAELRGEEPLDAAEAQRLLGRHGMKARPEGVVGPDGQQTGPVLLLATNSKAIKGILRGTPWPECWVRVLLRLHGSVRVGAQRFNEIGVSKAVAVPLELPESVENG